MTDTLRRSGGQPFPDTAMVTTDGDTILGNGTTADPLRVGSGSSGSSFQASFRGDNPLPGMPVFVSFVAPDDGGVCAVQLPSVVASEPNETTIEFASVVGVISAVNDDGTVQVQESGLLTLTTAQWDAVTQDLGGLQRGSPYYASIFDGVALAGSPAPLPGQWVTRVGTGISSTTLSIRPSAPRQNLGDLIRFGTWGGQPLPLGSAVRIGDAGSAVVGATDSSPTNARAVGVVCGLDVNGDPIVQVSGSVVLAPEDWANVTTNATILTAGAAYYVAPDAGKLAVDPPVSGQVVQVGVAFNAGVLIINAPTQVTAT